MVRPILIQWLLAAALVIGAPAFAKAKASKPTAPHKAAMEMSSTLKLAWFAAACDVKQIASLLAFDRAFDINEPAGSYTAVQLAMLRFVSAAKSSDLDYQTSCGNAIGVLMSDSRYNWKEAIHGKPTDYMFLLKQISDWTDTGKLNFVLDLVHTNLQKINTFDINYLANLPIDELGARTVAGVIAEGGNVKIWCHVRKRFPKMLDSIDKRLNDTQYSPVQIAAAVGKESMVTLLIAEGADWLAPLDNIKDPWPLPIIAQQGPTPTIRDWLIRHKQATVRDKDCDTVVRDAEDPSAKN